MSASMCKSCGAELVWALTDRGRQMPLSKASEQRRFVVTEIAGETSCSSQLTYTSHFSDCPNADQHRRST